MTNSEFEGFPGQPGLDLPPAQHLSALLGRVDAVSTPWSQFARALITRGRLPAPERELVILRVAFRRGCSYILGGHLRIGAHCGLSPGRMAFATGALGGGAPTDRDSALIRATDALLDGGRIPVGRRNQLAELFGEEEVIELTLLVGQYALISMLCETFELPPEERMELLRPG